MSSLDLAILGPAFLAGLLVLGQQVLRCGIVFTDLAIAQIAGLGVIAADLFGWEPQGMAVQVAAFGAAFSGALALRLSERFWPDVQEEHHRRRFCAGGELRHSASRRQSARW